jgi:DNA polymerase-3 subunit gamma/tau
MPSQYTVLARKWRPQQFGEVVGQEHVTTTLQNAIRKNRLAHAYLFVGPRGVGKTSTARIFAKALNCLKGPTVTPCDRCDNCKEIAEGRSFDVLEFDAASNTMVEQIREIILDTVKYVPAKAKYKIYLVDEVHMLSSSSFNALLKTLEEPPPHVIFFFATTDPQKVPLTILSRCQRFDLRRIPAAAMLRHLQHIAKSEKICADERALLAIVRGAEGSLRDAESALDQLIAFCGNEIVEDDVLNVFGLVAHDLVAQLADAIIDGKPKEALRLLRELVQAGKDLQRLHADLLAHFRNLLILSVSPDGNSLDVSDLELETLRKQVSRLEPDAVLRILETLADGESRLRHAISKQILLEVLMLQAIHARDAVSMDALLRRLNELKSKLGGAGGAPQRASSQTSERATEEPPAAAAPAAAHRAVPDLAEAWKELLDQLANARPFLHQYLIEARPLSLDGGVLTVEFPAEHAPQRALVDTPQNLQFLHTRLRQLLRQELTLRFTLDSTPAAASPTALPTPSARRAPEAAAAPQPSAPDKGASLSKQRADELRKDPLIQKALEIFRGNIVNARG